MDLNGGEVGKHDLMTNKHIRKGRRERISVFGTWKAVRTIAADRNEGNQNGFYKPKLTTQV